MIEPVRSTRLSLKGNVHLTSSLSTRVASTEAITSSDRRHEFLSLYPNRAQHIYKAPRDPKWKFSRVPLATRMIEAAVSLSSGTLYGAHWGQLTKFAVLDIDEESKYHNDQALEQLREMLASCGLPKAILYRSSRSGGWHLYLPFDDWAESKNVEARLKALLKVHGYELRGGQLEIFPSGNALRLPLQRGFAWLDDRGAVVLQREDTDLNTAVSRFLSDLETNRNSWAFAENLISSQLQEMEVAAGDASTAHEKAISSEGFDDLFSTGKIQENWQKGREFWLHGLTLPGQRHDAILFVGHYLWYGDPQNGVAALPGTRNDEYRAKLIEEWLINKHNGFCRHIDENKWADILAQIKRAVLWRRQKEQKDYEPYRLTERLLKRLITIYRKTGKVWTVDEFKQANDDRRDSARCKIRAAVEQCVNQGRQISRSVLASITGCSPNTLKKHADLWKHFAIGSGEYNPGGGGPVGLSLVRSSDDQKESLELLDVLGEKAEICASIQESCSPDPVLETGSTGNFVLPACSPVMYGRWRRRGKATGRRHRGSLASPSHTQPITGSKQKNPVCTCGLNDCLPSSAEPALGPLHLNPRKLFYKGSGSVLLQEGANSRGPPYLADELYG